tara:strand:- start:33 stop:713 length:681 start_codon:yes stop_codon:yes gene_type:complete
MSEIQSVNVFSVDEERLKFRAIVCPNIVPNEHQGDFEFILPAPTNFANNSQYSQAIIRLDLLTANPQANVADPVWIQSLGGAQAATKLGCIQVRLDVGSSQTETIRINNNAELAEGGNAQIGGFRQLVPIQVVNIGTSGAGAGAAGPLFTNEGACWTGIGASSVAEPILCANPFAQKLKLSLINPLDNAKVWLASAAAGPAFPNIGRYAFQFTITMIPNNRSEGTD